MAEVRAEVALKVPDRQPTYSDDARVHKALVDWLRPHPWDFVLHLTFGTERAPTGALRVFKNWTGGISRLAQQPISYFVSVESGRPHLHALIGRCSALQSSALEARWRFGWSRVRRFNPQRGGLWYATKECAKGAEYDFDLPGHADDMSVCRS